MMQLQLNLSRSYKKEYLLNMETAILYATFSLSEVCHCVNASAVQCSDFLAANPEVPGSIPGATLFYE
jgi:hypothetical protein